MITKALWDQVMEGRGTNMHLSRPEDIYIKIDPSVTHGFSALAFELSVTVGQLKALCTKVSKICTQACQGTRNETAWPNTEKMEMLIVFLRHQTQIGACLTSWNFMQMLCTSKQFLWDFIYIRTSKFFLFEFKKSKKGNSNFWRIQPSQKLAS